MECTGEFSVEWEGLSYFDIQSIKPAIETVQQQRREMSNCSRRPLQNQIIQNSKVNNDSNVIIIQKANTKSSVRQHRPRQMRS
jgi:hypothetical protein